MLASFVRDGVPNAFLNEARRRGLAAFPLAERDPYDRRTIGELRRAAIATSGPRVLVGHDYKANFVLARAARGLGIPRVALVHGYTGEDLKVRFFERLDRRRLSKANVVVAVSESVRDAALAAGVPPDRVVLVENGIDVERVAAEAAAGRAPVRAEFGVRDDEVLAVSIGRLSPEKGHRVLLDAWKRLGAAAPRLLLVGDGASRADLEAQAARLPAGRVTFAGWRADPTALVGAADVAILPSLTEGLPLALLEAMAAGTPVVATRVGGMPKALADGGCGLLVAPGDAEALANAVEELSDSSDGRRKLATAARVRVRESYDVGRQTRALEAIYRGLHEAPPADR